MASANKETRQTVLKHVISPIAKIYGLVALYLFFSQAFVQNRIRQETEKIRQQAEITSPRGIESIEMLIVGGIEQCISIRGWDKNNPVLLYLHGGPGDDQLLLARYFDSELEKDFVVVR